MKATVYRFGACTVCTTRREVALQGQPQVLEPRPFDLLVYLIEQRHRVVSKGELLQRLWQHDFVSDSVVARAVMKARLAIGDTGKEAALIRTVHRLGYRFIGELEQDGGTAAVVLPAASAPAAGAVSLALLPFDNRTGQAELDWIELGLMSLSAKALRTDPRLAVASTPSLLTALGTLNAQAALEERVRVVQQLLGVRHVVHVAVSREGGQFRIDYGIDCPPRGGAKSLLAAEVTELGHQLAREVEFALFPEELAVSIAFDSGDPLASQALAHAMQAVGEQKWKIAVNLLQVVLDIEPDNVAVQLEHVWALANQGADAALPAAERLLAHAESIGDNLLAALTHQAAGQAHISKRMYGPARHHFDESLRLAEGYGPQDWIAQTYILQAGIALMQRDFAGARALLGKGQCIHELGGNQVNGLRSTIYEALLHTRCGNPVMSFELGQKAVRLSKEYRLNDLFSLASLSQAHTCMELGLTQAAVRHAEDAFTAAHSQSSWRQAAYAGDALCLFYRELRAESESDLILTIMRTFAHELSPNVKAHLSIAQGHHAASRHDHVRAASLMRAPVDLFKSLGNWLTAHRLLPWLVTALVQSGDSEEAASVTAAARALPGYADDAELQAALLHCDALQAHLRHVPQAALDKLLEAADTAPMGLWRSHACMDATWLHLERGDVAAARRLLRDLSPWLSEHPVGMAVDARLKFAAGEFAAAHEAQGRYARTIQCEMPAYLAELADIYSATTLQAPSSVPALPPAPLLPTRM